MKTRAVSAPARSPSALAFATVVVCASACAHAPRAAADPKRTTSETTGSLVPYALDSDADVARAIREYYTKYEYAIPMRDGVKLYTLAYVPKDRTRTWPLLLTRTPYTVRPYGADNYPAATDARVLRRFAPSFGFVREGYAFVHQDVRGKGMSEGTFVDVRPAGDVDESTDAYDTVDFLVKHVPANNGRVGVWGISYPGFYAAQAAVHAHPAVRAVSPQAPVTDWFGGDDFHHNGAFFLADAFDFYAGFGKSRPQPTKNTKWQPVEHDAADAYDFFLALGPLSNANAKYLKDEIGFWTEMMHHPNRDAFWAARDPRPRYRDATPAVMTVGGFFDAEDPWGPLTTYRAFEGGRPRNENVLVMGPWAHGGWARTDGDHVGDLAFGQKTSLYYRERVELPFFRKHLKGTTEPALAEATIFETGTSTWRTFAAWPPKEARTRTLHFGPGGTLVDAAPAAGMDAFPSDPGKPVPYLSRVSPQLDHDWVVDDQRFAARRPDVLVYQTPPLDADVTLAGPLEADVWFSTTGTDADVVVKLVDVFPEDVADETSAPAPRLAGRQQLVRGEVMRARFRDGFDAPRAFRPDAPERVRFALPDVCHTFRRGHRLMVQVQSSWFPLVDRNPQTFVPSIYEAKPEDFKAQTHRVHRGGATPSSLRVTVLP